MFAEYMPPISDREGEEEPEAEDPENSRQEPEIEIGGMEEYPHPHQNRVAGLESGEECPF